MKYMIITLALISVAGNAIAATQGAYIVSNKTPYSLDVSIDFNVTKEVFVGQGPVLLPGQKVQPGTFGDREFHSTESQSFVLEPNETKKLTFVMSDDGTTRKPAKIAVTKRAAHEGMPIGLYILERDIDGFASEIIEEDGELVIQQFKHAIQSGRRQMRVTHDGF